MAVLVCLFSFTWRKKERPKLLKPWKHITFERRNWRIVTVFFKSFASSSKNIFECKILVQKDKMAFVWGRNRIKCATIAIAPKTKCSWSVEFGILLRVPPTPARPSPTPRMLRIWTPVLKVKGHSLKSVWRKKVANPEILELSSNSAQV